MESAKTALRWGTLIYPNTCSGMNRQWQWRSPGLPRDISRDGDFGLSLELRPSVGAIFRTHGFYVEESSFTSLLCLVFRQLFTFDTCCIQYFGPLALSIRLRSSSNPSYLSSTPPKAYVRAVVVYKRFISITIPISVTHVSEMPRSAMMLTNLPPPAVTASLREQLGLVKQLWTTGSITTSGHRMAEIENSALAT